MIRKLLVIAAAVAVPVSVIAVGGGIANASNPRTVGTDTITCKTLTGTLTFSPKIDAKGYTSGTVKTKVVATVSGCTVSGSTKVTGTVTGSTTGTLSGTAGTNAKPAGQCSGLATGGTETGTLTTKWSPAAAGSSILGVKSTAAGSVGSGASAHGTFTIPGKVRGSASGSFLGSDGGKKDTSLSEATLPTSTIGATCLKSGLTSVKIQNVAGKAAVSLG